MKENVTRLPLSHVHDHGRAKASGGKESSEEAQSSRLAASQLNFVLAATHRAHSSKVSLLVGYR